MATTKDGTGANGAKAKGEKKERAKKGGLRAPQARLLNALVEVCKKAKKPEDVKDLPTRKALADLAGCDPAWMNSWLGAVDPEKRKANDDRNGWPSLLSAGYVVMVDRDGARVYFITPKGREAVAAYDAAAKAQEKAAE